MLTVAIVGRPNVGKSTLFNRLIKQKIAITDDTPGVTRDRIFGEVEWLTKKFKIIDTGGLVNTKNSFQKNIEEQINAALIEANIILFMCSYKDGINNDDIYASKLIKKIKNKLVLFVLNKIENTNSSKIDYSQFYSFGFGAPMLISAEHGIGIGDLLDKIIEIGKDFKTKNIDDQYEAIFSIIGKPNVGKSSLLNALLNSERALVSEVAGTTRDAIDEVFKFNNKLYKVIDTAGIRRKGKINSKIEKYSLLKTESAINRSQFILLMIDATKEISEQDEVIGGLAFDSLIPTIIVVNKWDAVEKNEHTMNEFSKIIKSRFKYLSWAPIVFISAQKKQRINTIFAAINTIKEQLNKKISTSLLNDVILNAQISNQAPIFNGDRLKITYVTQAKSQVPTFVLFCNNPKFLHFSYSRYIEKKIRESFGFYNTPITLYFKSKNARNRDLDPNIKFKQEGYKEIE
ncbi:ribosome biogenesis GTPase Der [Mycoplasmoides pirum]|uniref:ribosome biogenesis GTPase Der n=1 Tax=Mycoplasmoides pirum TaxID=2122 RepID=UPI0004810F30|nr:ribosome biogenesis GTPase Der [Mycoplasmoides pirum]